MNSGHSQDTSFDIKDFRHAIQNQAKRDIEQSQISADSYNEDPL